jgi:hypothetical protein
MKFRKGLGDAYFTEGSVLMLAREHWGVNLDRWDTASSPPAPSDDTGPDTTGMVAWQAATLEKWDEIENDFGRFPAARKVLTWLRQQGPRDVFPEEQPQARDTAEWLDRDGNRQTLTLKNLANRMSEWRQWGWIPSREK